MNLYPTLLGIDWAIDNQTIINFKKRILTFEDARLWVVGQIDPLEEHRYVKQVNSEGKYGYLDHIYNITSTMDDYVNPTADRKLSWWSLSSYTSYSREAMENWNNRLHGVSLQKCARITKTMRRVDIEVCDLPTYEGLPNLESFLTKFK